MNIMIEPMERSIAGAFPVDSSTVIHVFRKLTRS